MGNYRCHNCRTNEVSPCQWVEERKTCLQCEDDGLVCTLKQKDKRMKGFFQVMQGNNLPSFDLQSNPSPAPQLPSASSKRRKPESTISVVPDESNRGELKREIYRLSQLQKKTDDELRVLDHLPFGE